MNQIRCLSYFEYQILNQQLVQLRKNPHILVVQQVLRHLLSSTKNLNSSFSTFNE